MGDLSLNMFLDDNNITDIDIEAVSSMNKEQVISMLMRASDLAKKLDFVIEKSLDGIFITNGKGDIVKVNKAYETISGFRREDLIGINMASFDGTQVSRSGTMLVLKSKKPTTIEQIIYKTGVKVLVTCNPIIDKNNEISLVVSNVRDMTEIERLKHIVTENEELVNRYKNELDMLKDQLEGNKNLIIEDHKMLDVIYQGKRVAATDSSVLLLGETGVGKEEVAKFIHDNSKRKNEGFVKVNCSAIPINLFESEMFGYEKGAFTGANPKGKKGFFEIANNGTIFLDEISELPLDVQAKLLRVLQENELKRIGSEKPISINARVVAATNRDLRQMVAEGIFREDLYYRIKVIPITIPPLRDRQGDIIPLAKFFTDLFNNKYNYRKELSTELAQYLMLYKWPGNVRELKNVIEYAVIMSESKVMKIEDFPVLKSKFFNDTQYSAAGHETKDLKSLLEEIEGDYVIKAYERYKSIRKAAKHLGLPHTTYANKLAYYSKKSNY